MTDFKIAAEHSFEIEAFSLFIFAKEIESSTRKINRLTLHVGRCKKIDDRIKLSIMIFSNVEHVTNCIKSMCEIRDRMFAQFVQSIPTYKPGMLIEPSNNEKVIK
jgi:hypothetical protein